MADAGLLVASRTKQDSLDIKQDGIHLKMLAITGIAVGFAAVALLASRGGSWTAFASIAANGLALSGAAALVGSLLGFLFGIPRTGFTGETTTNSAGALRTSTDADPAKPGQPGGGMAAMALTRSGGYTPNTGLEQVSDWLTKILVGVGLTQLLNVRDALGSLATRLTTDVVPGSFFVALMIYFAVVGFLVGYVWTRVVLSPMFKRADLRLGEVQNNLVAAQEVLQATVQKAAEAPTSVNETLTNMASDLYNTKNQGWRQAIAEGQRFLASYDEPKNSIFWVYLAAAHGQRAEAAQQGGDHDEFQRARGEALTASRKALSYDADGRGRTWLKSMLEAANADEDDLQAFQGDPEFQALFR